MKETPVLKSVYSRIDILEFDRSNDSFVKSASIFMIGSAVKYVKSIKDFNTKNKQLVASIGIEAVKTLSISETIDDHKVGGDDWSELDDMDLEEILNDDTIKVADVVESTSSKSVFNGIHFADITLFETDKAGDICEKIAMQINVEPYLQYVWIPSERKSIIGNEVNLMNYWTNSLRKIEGYPVDGKPTETYEIKSQLSLNALCKSSSVVLTCVCLDSLIQNKSSLQFIARSDSESYELIHSNAVQQFFPLITLPVFNQYLIDKREVLNKYESCYFDFKQIKNRYVNQIKLISDLNNQKRITIESSDLLAVTTTGMDMSASYGDNIVRVDTANLFQSMDITALDPVAFIDLYCLDDEIRSVRLRKIQQRDQFRLNKEDPMLTIGTYTKKKLIQSKSIIITLLPQNEFDVVKIIVDRYGSIIIRMQPNQTKSYSKSAFVDYISEVVNPIIDYMNAFNLSFNSHERFAKLKTKLGLQYQYPSSSSKLSFRFAMSYNKLLDLIINKLASSGFVSSINNQEGKRNNPITSFGIVYGVSKDEVTGFRRSSIDIRSVSGMAIIVLSNLDVDETNLYVDIIGRLINLHKKELSIPTSEQSQLSIIDPVLFRTKVSSDGYSRICQKKFQPVVSTSSDPKAVKYHNFTFERAEYYSCPSKTAPVLGFIVGKHENGYCLPCCRKTKQPNVTKVVESCIANRTIDKTKLSTYKIDYPIIEISNSKIMNRRISLPEYITQLLGIPTAVANGTILSTHGGIRDGINPNTKSYLQTSLILSAIENAGMKPIYDSSRELILDIIALIKQPLMQVSIMKNKLVSTRFTTPQSLIHAIEDYYIRDKILDLNANLSAVEWNDLIIFLANCMGLNVLLLADERTKSQGIQIMNLHDIDVYKPVSILIRRTNIEWSSRHHNTRAVYLPITSSAFKVLKISMLIIPRFNISKSLTKIKRITSGSIVSMVSKQLTIDRIQDVVSNNKAYKVLDDLSEQKLAVIGLGKAKVVSSIYTLTANIKPSNINIEPSASFKDLCRFISEYNTYFLNETENIKQDLKSYKNYITVALKTTNRYQYVMTKAFLLKIHRLIVHESMVIGVILNIIDINKVVSTELMFMKPISVKNAKTELTNMRSELIVLQTRVNIQTLISFPISTEVLLNENPANDTYSMDHVFIHWLNNPLKSSNLQPKSCKEDLRKEFSRGIYHCEIYNILVSDIVKAWKSEHADDIVDLISRTIKQSGSIPISNTKLDKLIVDIDTKLNYDTIIVRDAVGSLFDLINTIDKNTTDAISRLKNSDVFFGFELKNVHRYNKSEIRSKISSLMKELTVKTSDYPTFDVNISVKNQKKKFYDIKSAKLIVHKSLYDDITEMIVSDLSNPFRREYITNIRLVESSLSDMRPHLGELIYVQKIRS